MKNLRKMVYEPGFLNEHTRKSYWLSEAKYGNRTERTLNDKWPVIMGRLEVRKNHVDLLQSTSTIILQPPYMAALESLLVSAVKR